jgi:Fe-S cluster assembly scaffold protein SufB
MTTIEQTLELDLKQSQLLPPDPMHDDWVHFKLQKLLKTSFSSTNISPVDPDLTGNYLYFCNGILVMYDLPKNATIKKEGIDPIQTKNSFIHFTNKKSETYRLTISNCRAEISIFYVNTSNVQCTGIACDITDSNIIFNRLINITNENTMTSNYIKINAQLNSTVTINEQNIENKGHLLDFTDVILNENCHYNVINQTVLSNQSRFQNRVFLNEENATSRIHGIAINNINNESHFNTHIYHNAPNTESHQLFKSLNKLNATFEYNGKVSVAKNAQHINSYQLNKNILIDDTASIYSRPQLFIDADDVKCSHGSTTGDINKVDIFYLMSRGLSEKESRKLLAIAFIDACFHHSSFDRFNIKLHDYLTAIL